MRSSLLVIAREPRKREAPGEGPGPRTATAALLLLLLLAGCARCDQTFTVPDPGLERMLEQPRADVLEATDFFDDLTLVRIPPDGTVPYAPDPEPLPPPLTPQLLDEGEALFNTTCGACHGIAGDGDTVVARFMRYVKPRDLHVDMFRDKPAAYFYEIATSGYGLMPSYRGHLTDRERWAVAYYVKVLQLSRSAPIDELPSDVREALR